MNFFRARFLSAFARVCALFFNAKFFLRAKYLWAVPYVWFLLEEY